MSRLWREGLVNDLNPPVFLGERIRLVLRSLLSVAGGVKICRGQIEVVYQITAVRLTEGKISA